MPDALARKVGPLPVWGWIVAALAVFLLVRRRTESGWFGTGSFDYAPGASRAAVALGAMFGTGGGAEPESEEPSGAGFTGLGRETQPASIVESGTDGTVYSGGGGGGTTTTTYAAPTEGYTPPSGSIKPGGITLPGGKTIQPPK